MEFSKKKNPRGPGESISKLKILKFFFCFPCFKPIAFSPSPPPRIRLICLRQHRSVKSNVKHLRLVSIFSRNMMTMICSKLLVRDQKLIPTSLHPVTRESKFHLWLAEPTIFFQDVHKAAKNCHPLNLSRLIISKLHKKRLDYKSFPLMISLSCLLC